MSNMKLNKAPCGVTQTVPIIKGNSVSSEGDYDIRGGILKGTKYAWLCQGPFLKIIDVSSGEKIAGWRFGASFLDFITDVTCAVELPHSDDASNLKQIILGLQCEIISGMICIFDVQGSRLLRAIRIPGKPLSLSIVDSGSSGCEGRYPLPGLLSSMSGIIAVGLQGGSVILIDLCRLSCEELLNTWFNDDREEVHDEMNPSQLLPINKDDDDSGTLEKKCAAAAVSGDHVCLHLNDGAIVQDNFLLLQPGGEVSACFKTQNVGVTSLLYVPQIASLVVGYSFGCFQLWNLMHLTLNYTSLMMKDPLPVMHLGFQEPSDDPCNFCYLWTVHSSTDEFPSSSHPVGIMYALSYDSKEWVDGYGCLYQDYQYCHFRFEYNLEVDSSDDVDSIVCVSFSTLNNVTAQRNMPEDGCDEVSSENDFSLCTFAWEAYDSDNKPISTYLSLFDLNQWYKDQMPIRVTEDEDEQLGYLVTFSLNCIRQKGDGAAVVETPLLDVKVDPQNLSQFKSFQPQEEHYHPSALSFVSLCLLEDAVVSLSHPGLQRYLLLYMEKEGPICLLHPVNLFKHCVMVGLRPVLMDINGASEVPAVTQREFLLSVALENQMLGFLHRCASDWANGSVSGVDCSLPMLLSWGFQRALVLKETADELCVHLFDHTGIRLDKNECRLLDNCASQLRQLATLFEGILGDCRLFSLLNIEDFKQKTNELTLVALYFEVLLWFLNVGLLPEFPENNFGNESADVPDMTVDKIPYPAVVLTKFYTNRRHEFKTLNLKNSTKASLYIDQLLQNEANGSILADLWLQDGGSGMYPPPSIQSLLAMYLQDGIDIQTKNSIVIYVFLDLATLLDPERYKRTIEYFVKFPCAFCMTPSIIKVTQAFWLLDQKHFEDALDMVLDPLVSPKDLQPWQHRFIVHALLSQGQHSKALEYFTVRQLPIQGIEDIQLKITLLVMNKQVTQAYNFLQQYHNEENNKDLLYHFYQECGRVQQLGTVLKLMLSPTEEELLMNYLQNCSISQSDDMQVVFYLMRSRVIEAVAVNERINFSGTRKLSGRRPRNDPTVRDVLVSGYAKTLPSVTRQLANYCSQQKKSFSSWRQVQRPTPMSVDVHYGSKQPVSYKSSLIHATLEKARETWIMPVHTSCGIEARNKDGMDITAMQNLPFLCTSHDTLRHDREATPVVFPSVTSHSIKRRLDEDGSAQLSTPAKRSRLESTPPMDTFLLSNKKKYQLEHSANNSSLLLKSPLVKRVTPLKQFKDCSDHEKNQSKPFAGTFTRQSILKVRNLVRSSTSPEHETSGFSNSDVLPRDLNQERRIDEKYCARQIRFSLPVVKDIEDEKPLSSSTPTSSTDKVKISNRIIDASARLPIRSSLSLLQKSAVFTSEDVFSAKKETLTSKSSENRKVNQNNIFVFGSTNSTRTSLVSDWKRDKTNSDVGIQKINDSLGEESFYSAASSSDSEVGKSYSKEELVDAEISPSYNGDKYIHTIKDIKPRRQLSRLISGSQNNVIDNFVSERQETLNEEHHGENSTSEEKNSKSGVNDNGEHDISCKEHFVSEIERKQDYFSAVQKNPNDNDDHDPLNNAARKDVFVENKIDQNISSSEDDESEDLSVVSVYLHNKSILGDSFIDNNDSHGQNNDFRGCAKQSSIDERDISCEEHFVSEIERKPNYFSAEQNNSDDDDGDDVHDTLNNAARKGVFVEKETNQNTSSSEDDENENLSIMNVSLHKKSILGDTFIDNNGSYGQNKDFSRCANQSGLDESYISSANESRDLQEKTCESRKECSIVKIQEIKARRPLSRLRTSEIVDTSFKNVSIMEKYSNLESSLSNRDIHPGTAHVEMSSVEVNENEEVNDSKSEVDSSSLPDNKVGTETAGSTEIVEDRSDFCSVPILSDNEENLMTSFHKDGRHQMIREENVIATDPTYVTEIPGNMDHQVYIVEDASVLRNREYTYSNIQSVDIDRNAGFSKNGDTLELLLDGEKTYASLTAVTTAQTGYEHLLPLQSQSSLVGSDMGEYRNPLAPTYTIYDTDVCQRNFVADGATCSVQDAGSIDDNEKKHLSNRNDVIENMEISVETSSTSAAGDTSGTIDIESDESEEKNNTQANVEKQEKFVQIIVEEKMGDYRKSSYAKKDNFASSSVNVINLDEGMDHNDDEIIVLNSDIETAKVVSVTGCKKDKICTTLSPDQYLHNQEVNEDAIVLKHSGGENDSKDSSDDNSEKTSETNRESNQVQINFSPVSVNLEKRLHNMPLAVSSPFHTEVTREEEYEINNKITEGKLAFSDDNIVPLTAVKITNQHGQDEMKTGSCSGTTTEKVNILYSSQYEHSRASGDVTLVMENKYCAVEEEMQDLSPTKEQVSISQSTNIKVLKNADNLMPENQLVELAIPGTPEQRYDLRCMQISHPSTQSVPQQSADILSGNDVKDQSFEPSSAGQNRLRRRSSLQIEPTQISDVLKSKGRSKQEVHENSPSRNRRRNRASSVQSEPPEMMDLCKMENQFNDKDSEVSQVHLGVVSEDNVGLSVMPVSSAPRTRQRSRPSSVQGEPPQMSNDSESENQSTFQSVKVSHEHSGESRRQRRRRSSLQIAPTQVSVMYESENGTTVPQVGESSTSGYRLRGRPSSVQSEPPCMSDVCTPEKNARNHVFGSSQKYSDVQNANIRQSSLQFDSTKTDDVLISENKGHIIFLDDCSTSEIKQKKSQSSVQSDPPQVAEVPFSVQSDPSEINVSLESGEQKQPNKRSSNIQRNGSSELHASVPTDIPKLIHQTPDLQLPASSEFELSKMNLRSQRSLSVERESFYSRKRETGKVQLLSDSDTNSVQSEPPRLRDISEVTQLRKNKSRKIPLRKKSRKTSYALRIPSAKLACVKEEPENEISAVDSNIPIPCAQSENEMSHVFVTGRNLRSRKHSESASSQASSVGGGRQLRSRPVDADDKADSPISISSRSTVILDKTYKRKRSSSASSPEEQKFKKFVDEHERTAFINVEGQSKGKDANSGDAIEEYATARRLTRYQKTLMERSMEVTKGVLHELHRSSRRHSEINTEDSDGESEASGYTSASSHVRSSARLQEKRLMAMDRSPHSAKVSVSGDQTPQKQVSRRHLSITSSTAEHVEDSPGSVRSAKSVGYASSVSSSQWPSPSPHSPSGKKPRRKSFQNAQKALFSPSMKKLSSATTDTSEAGDSEDKSTELLKTKNEDSETGSVRSQSSAVSSTLSGNTRSSSKNKELGKSDKVRTVEVRLEDITKKIPVKDIQRQMELWSGSSTSTEDSPKKNTETQEELPMSEGGEFPARESESQLGKGKSETRKSYSAFRTRKYLRIQTKRKT